MKRWTIRFLLCATLIIGCFMLKNKEEAYSGVNVEILSIQNNLIVGDIEGVGPLEGEYTIDISECPIYYVDFKTHELSEINGEDLCVGDFIIIDFLKNKVDGKLIKPEQIQLISQK